MPTTSIDDLLSIDTLTGLVKTFADQSDNRSCTTLFARYARPLLPAGESVSWDEVEYSRHLAPVSGPESPHTRAKRLGVRKRGSALATIKVYKDLPASHLFLHRAPGTNVQDAEAILTAELEDMGNLIGNTKEFLAANALLGLIEVDPVRVPGSDVVFRVEFGVPELGVGGNTGRRSWADPDTPIRSDELAKLKEAYKNQSGLRAEIVITEPRVEGYLTRNKDVRELAKDALGLTILNNLNGQGVNPQWALLGGLGFRFTDGSYKPEGGPITHYFPDDHLLVLPNESRLSQILGWAEGKVFVPGGSVFAGTQAATGLVRELRGTYAYAEVRTDPMGVRVYAGWHGLPLVLNPSAVLKFKVTP
ncbi:MAG: major capsid protein [Planctomycetes bacterium]|nr:major capsid protein [Planctomycetota bacterium]